LADSDGEKSQDATQHRREQAREKGQVARSQDLGSGLLLLGGLTILWWTGGALIEYMGSYTMHQLGGKPWLTADVDFATNHFHEVVGGLSTAMLPIFLGLMALGVVCGMMQVGILFLPEKLMPDFSRLDPLAGFSRIFSMSGAARLFFGSIKILVAGSVAYVTLSSERDTILLLTELSIGEIGTYLLEILFWTTIKIAAALVLLALLDYGFQWWKQEQDLRMTQQEVREEMKNLQGDPQIAARRRQVQRQLVMARLSSTVPKADVIITNPTELAIAIQYEPATMAAPIVVAKGAGVLAQRIRRLALENGIPIVEKKPLAQALYKEVDVDRPVPHQMYAAVAEVLAYVYQLKNKKMPKLPK
jgi:flagellar biosynthetic protein FlhB